MIVGFLGREQDKKVALRVMEKLVEKRQGNADALFAYALLAMRAEEIGKARAAMEQLLKITPVNNNIALAYLSILQKQGDMHTAVDWLKASLAQNAAAFDLRMIYARLLADTQRYDEARAEFEALAKEQPQNADARFALGLLYMQGSQFDKARENFTPLTQDESYQNEASFYLGQIAEASKEYESALHWYSSVAKGEMLFDAQLGTALVFAKLNRIAEAGERLRSVKASTPEERARAVRVEGEILSQEGQYDAALALYDRAIGDKFDPDLLYSRAMLAEKMGRLDILERDLRLILKNDPNNVQALNALGYTLADKTNRLQEAYELVKKALELKPNDFYILDSMGWVLFRLGRLPDAVSHLRRAKELRNDPEVAAHLGEVLWTMGDKQGAKEAWESGLRAAPGDQKLLDFMKRLAP
jgi:tetratricopeptide (TPR) repeat protein